jgi:hypothetical protein
LEFSSPSFPALATAVFCAVITATAAAQSVASSQPPADTLQHQHQHPMPAPTNLKVLPKTLTGEQVHEIMHGWEAALGTECSTCHAADPKRIGPNGKPGLDFADDSKPKKAMARLMVTMVDQINSQYISKLEDESKPVTCATCHRGHLDPPPFTPPPDHEHHEHTAPTSSSGKPAVPK